MKQEKVFCDRCKNEIEMSVITLTDDFQLKDINLCSTCHDQFLRLMKQGNQKIFFSERKFSRWKDTALFSLALLVVLTITIIALTITGVCK